MRYQIAPKTNVIFKINKTGILIVIRSSIYLFSIESEIIVLFTYT